MDAGHHCFTSGFVTGAGVAAMATAAMMTVRAFMSVPAAAAALRACLRLPPVVHDPGPAAHAAPFRVLRRQVPVEDGDDRGFHGRVREVGGVTCPVMDGGRALPQKNASHASDVSHVSGSVKDSARQAGIPAGTVV